MSAYRLGDCDWPEHPPVRASFLALPFSITVVDVILSKFTSRRSTQYACFRHNQHEYCESAGHSKRFPFLVFFWLLFGGRFPAQKPGTKRRPPTVGGRRFVPTIWARKWPPFWGPRFSRLWGPIFSFRLPAEMLLAGDFTNGNTWGHL